MSMTTESEVSSGRDLTDMEDATLLRQFLSKEDTQAFAEIYRRHQPWVLATCRRQLGSDAAEAEDAAQAVFVGLVKKGHTIRNGQALARWLHRMAGFVCGHIRRTHARRRRREATVEEDMERNAEAPPIDWGALRPHIDEAIEELPAKQRAAVIRHFLEGASLGRIARESGRSKGAVQSLVQAGLEKLRMRLTCKGITATSVVLATALTQHAADGAELLSLAAAHQTVCSTITVAGDATGTVGALLKGGQSMMAMAKLKTAAMITVTTTLIMAGGASLGLHGRDASPAKPTKVSFYWDMEKLQANIFKGAGEPLTKNATYALTDEIEPVAGKKCLRIGPAKFCIAEFITDDQKTKPYEGNPDFDFNLGTVEFYFQYSESKDWVRGAQLVALKNELDDPMNVTVNLDHEGKIRFNYCHSKTRMRLNGVKPKTWHKVTVKWRRVGTQVDIHFQLDRNPPLVRKHVISEKLAQQLDKAVGTQIFAGNDTVNQARYYLDEYRIWKSWREEEEEESK